VGSVTRITKSAAATVSIKGHDVPGGESRIAIPVPGSICLIAAFMTGTADMTPISILLSMIETLSFSENNLTTPRESGFSLMAP